MIGVSYHDRVKILQGVSGALPSPFVRPEWFGLLEEAGAKPLVAVASFENRQVALPLTHRDGCLQPLINWYSFTWRPIGQSDDELLTKAASKLKSKAARISLWPLPDEDGSASALESAFRNAGWVVRREQCDHNHVLEVKGRSFSEYWAGRTGRMRTTLKRKAKKVRTSILTHFDPQAWNAYERIYASSWKPAEGDPALLRQFAQQEGEAGRIRLAVAEFDGEPIAAQFWTVESGTAYIHKLAHLEEHKALSAGTTLTAALFEHVIDVDRVELVDFGTGNDAYKADWMEDVRPRFRLDCLDPRSPKVWPALLKHAITRVARSVQQS